MIERGNFAVYVEGEKIPFTTANVSLRGNNYTTATVSMPSSFRAHLIRRFSMVQIYYYDPYVSDSTGKVRYNPSENNWFLLWEGVVIGANYSKTSSATSYSLLCADYMVYLAGTKGVLFNWRAWDPSYNIKRLAIGQKDLEIDPAGFGGGEWVDQFFQGDINPDSHFSDRTDPSNLVDVCLGFLNNWADNMPLMKFHMDRIRFMKKFNATEDDKIIEIFNVKKMQEFMKRKSRSFAGEAALLDFFNSLVSRVMYNYINVGPARYDSEGLRNIILKPDTFFSIPPACNVIFPDQIISMNTQEDYLNEPTRTRLPQRLGLPNNGWNINYLAPIEIGDKLGLYPDSDKPSPAYILGTKSPTGDVSKEKYLYLDDEIEGILNLNTASFNSEIFSIDTNKEDPYNRRLAIMADYLYKVNRYGSQPQKLSMKFSPQIAPMFSAVALDRHSSVMGYITDVTHTINSDGHCATHANMGMVRYLKYNKDKPLDPKESTQDVSPPLFLSSSFDRDKINSTYEDLLGCKSAKKSGVIKNIAISINEIFALDGSSNGEYYEQVEKGSAHEYINSFTKRKVATMNEVKKHYGLSVDESESPVVDSMEHVESEPNPFDYNGFAKKNSATGSTDIEPEHKKKIVKQIRNRYKGIIDGR